MKSFLFVDYCNRQL